MTSCVLVLGTRAEFLKCVPLIQNFEAAKIDYLVVLTGQNFVDDLIEEFKVPRSKFLKLSSFAGIATNLIGGIRRTPQLIAELRKTLRSLDCRCVVFHGDTATTFATTLATRNLECATAHVEAGLRSKSILEPFPEELFRTLADRVSDLLFAPSRTAVENLTREKLRGEIIFAGNTVCDLLKITLEKIGGDLRQGGDFVLVTSHRYENIFFKSRLKKIIEILGFSRFPIIWPLHQMTRNQLRRFGLMECVEKLNVKLIPPLRHDEFVSLLLRSKYVITDGGSIEEEATILGKSCLLLRKRTERGEGLNMGISYLTRLDTKQTGIIMRKLEGDYSRPMAMNPYIGDKSPSTIITEYLSNRYC